jgi:predicted Zn-dependent protease with MMP-like domain
MEVFGKLVEEALGSLPSIFKEKLDNVDVVIEDWPTVDIAKGRLLLGLYQGIPKTTYGKNYAVLPDKITIFRGPIELLSRGDEQALKNLVIDTVEHEIAHHFGISDARLQEIKS